MKFDYFVTHTRSDASTTYEKLYADGLEQIGLCDGMGIDTIWFPEHQFTNQLCSPAPLINVVDAAHRTRRVRLGTAVVITPYYDPLLLAGQAALADQLTQGRLEIGFGRGGFRYEYERLGMTEPLAAARQQEALEVILRAWTETDYAYAGTYFKFPEVTVVPRPFQRPCPPTWIAARTPDSLRFAAEHGIGIMMAPQRQPISRLQGQMRLLDAICEDLGVVRPPVRITREIWVTTSPAEARQVAELLAEVPPGAVEPPPERGAHRGRVHRSGAAAHGIRHLPRGADRPGRDRRSRDVRGADSPVRGAWRRRVHRELRLGQPQRSILRSMELFAERVHAALRRRSSAAAARAAGWAARRSPHDRAGEPPLLIDIDGLAGRLGHLGSRRVARASSIAPRPAGAGGATSSTSPPTPKVRAHADGAVDNHGLLRLISDIGCPDCGRPVIALFRRWQDEDRARDPAGPDGAHARAPVARASQPEAGAAESREGSAFPGERPMSTLEEYRAEGQALRRSVFGVPAPGAKPRARPRSWRRTWVASATRCSSARSGAGPAWSSPTAA